MKRIISPAAWIEADKRHPASAKHFDWTGKQPPTQVEPIIASLSVFCLDTSLKVTSQASNIGHC